MSVYNYFPDLSKAPLSIWIKKKKKKTLSKFWLHFLIKTKMVARDDTQYVLNDLYDVNQHGIV